MHSTVSIVIPTINRTEIVVDTVRSIMVQSVKPKEIIIVDQNDSYDCKTLFDNYWKEYGDESVRIIYIMTPEQKSSTVSRNIGICNASGEIILFLDDDVTLEKDVVENILIGYYKKPDAGGIGGVVTNYTRPLWKQRFWQWVFFRGKFRDERQPLYWSANEGNKEGIIRVSKLCGGLMSFRRDMLMNNLFDENMDGYAFGEDVELSERISLKFPLYVNMKARLVHHRASGRRTEIPYRYMEAKFFTYIFKKLYRQSTKGLFCFIWLCFGMILRGSCESIKLRSYYPVDQVLRGIHDGWAIIGKHVSSRIK